VIIFGSVWFLSKKVTKPNFFFLKKKNETEPKPGQTDWFRFGFFREKTGSNRFDSVFPVLARFFSVWLGFFGLARFWLGFSSLTRFWLGLARFFSGFLSVSVRFCFLLIKPKPNRPVFSKI
jgi:hypothetical protein